MTTLVDPPLAPCPFAHDAGLALECSVEDTEAAWWVECLGCGAQGPAADTREEAVALWNRRAAPVLATSQVDSKSDRAALRALVDALATGGYDRAGYEQAKKDGAADEGSQPWTALRQAWSVLDGTADSKPDRDTVRAAALEEAARAVEDTDVVEARGTMGSYYAQLGDAKATLAEAAKAIRALAAPAVEEPGGKR